MQPRKQRLDFRMLEWETRFHGRKFVGASTHRLVDDRFSRTVLEGGRLIVVSQFHALLERPLFALNRLDA